MDGPFSHSSVKIHRSSPSGLVAGVALACFGALLLWRISFESSIWCDEVYSLMLVGQPLGRLIELTAVDAHPPLYYLLLKGWLAMGRGLGLEPGIMWARLPGVGLWLGLVAVAWRVGGRTLGARGGALLAAILGLSAQAAWMFRNVRGYGLATAGLGVCFLVLHGLAEADRRGDLSRREAAWGWGLYAVAGAAALWSHLLAAFVLLLLGLWWTGESVCVMRRGGGLHGARRPFVLGGVLAHAAVLLAFAPWLVELHRQFGSIAGERLPWMTPVTFFNLVRVFLNWFPYGAPGGYLPSTGFWLVEIIPSGLALLAPLGAALHAGRHRRGAAPDAGGGPARRLAIAGFSVAVVNTLILWSVDRLGIQPVFYGPRYTVFGVLPWAAGICGLCLMAVRGGPEGRKGMLLWLLAAPWLACSLAGTGADMFFERRGGLPAALNEVRGELPPPGGTLYVMPGDLIPFYRRTLDAWELRPARDLALLPEGATNIDLLSLNPWPIVAGEEERAIEAKMEEGTLADAIHAKRFPRNSPNPREIRTLYHLDGLHAARAR